MHMGAHLPLAFGSFGGPELLVILLIILVLFGGAKLPSLARGLGQSIKEFKKASRDDEDEHKTAASPSDSKKTEPATPPHGTS